MTGQSMPWWFVFIVPPELWLLIYFIVVAALTVGSVWIIGIRMRRRIEKDLGGAVYEGDLTSIETWMKVDKVEQKTGAGPNRDWVPKSSNEGIQTPESFAVVRPFEASEPISGRKRRVVPGQTVIADLGLIGSDVTIELNMAYLVVDFLTFSNCCKRITENGLREIWP